MTSVWGPCFWKVIHMVALGYPEQPSGRDQAQYRAWFEALGAVLPCGKCSANFARHYAEMPVDGALAGGRDALFAWTVEFHNVVNRETGKRVWTVEQARARYERMFQRGGEASGSGVREHLLVVNTMLSVVLAIVLVASVIYFRSSK